MMHVFDSWLVWLGLGGGTIGLIVLAFVAPSVLDIASKVLSGLISLAVPLLRPAAAAVGKWIGKFISGIGTGALRVLDDGKQISFVVTVCVACYGAGGYFGAAHANERVTAGDCKPVIARLHTCFWFNPKKSAPAICRK